MPSHQKYRRPNPSCSAVNMPSLRPISVGSRHTSVYHLNSNDDESVPATLLNRRRRAALKTHNQCQQSNK
eukprot:scaffold158_cov103-Skeletonema_dohrnii-CCMP3373.AAC.8